MLEMVMIIQVMAGKIQYTVRNEDDFEGIEYRTGGCYERKKI